MLRRYGELHPEARLSIKKGELTDRHRANAASQGAHDGFFANYKTVGGDKAPPDLIGNLDETALTKLGSGAVKVCFGAAALNRM